MRAVFGDLPFLEDTEAVALENFRAAPILEGDDLAEDLFLAVGSQMVEVLHEQLAGAGNALCLGKQVEMEMGNAARSGGNLAPGIEEDPADEGFRRFVVARIAEDAFGEEAQIGEAIEGRRPEPPTATEPVTPQPTPPAPPDPAGEAVTPAGKPTPTETAATGSAETTPAGPRLTKPKPEMPPRGLPLLFEFKRLNSSLITTLEGYRDSLTGPRRAALDELLQLRQQKEDSKKLPRQEASRAFPNKAQQRLRELSKQFEDAEFNIRANAGLARFISAAVPIPARELKATEYRPAITLPKGYVLEGDRYVYKPSAATETEAKPDKAGKVQTAPDDVKQVFATLDSPQGSKARVRKMIKGTYPEIGPKAIFINDNIEQIIAEAEANGKVTKECP